MIDRSFFEKDAETVAQKLLGKVLKINNRKLIITETEAYPATDSACYGKDQEGNQKITEATKPLFEKPGTVCIYGGMILISCNESGTPENVLIRRGGNESCYLEGPYSLGKYFDVSDSFYELHGADILSEDSIIKISEEPKIKFTKTTRVGLSANIKDDDYKKEFRFILLNND